MTNLVLCLLIAFQVKQFKADWGFFVPLLSHCWTHAFMTLLIFSVALGQLHTTVDIFGLGMLPGALAILDLVLHFVMDRIKAGPKYMGRWKALSGQDYQNARWLLNQPDDGKSHRVAREALRRNKFFWWALGFDQFFHHMTHYGLIVLFLAVAS
jgi:hypothetical protein